jgi:hypothetical protein
MNDKTEIRNATGPLGGTKTNADKTPIKEVVESGKPVAEIRNATGPLGGTKKNSDGTPIQEVVKK